VEVRTNADRDGFLIYGDSWYPGWNASIDGEDVKIWRTDLFGKGVSVDAGMHTVRFWFEPTGVLLGEIIAVLTLLGLAMAWWRSRRHRRRSAMADTTSAELGEPGL